MNRRNNSVWHIIVSSPITLIVALIALSFLARSVWNIHQKSADIANREAEARAELERLESQKANLTSAVSSLSTNEGVEAALREKYRAVSPGESVAVIVDNSPASASSSGSNTTDNSSEPMHLSWWQKLLGLIGL